MMNHSLKSQSKVTEGTVIQGKWHCNQYTVIKELGNGANGIVYLAKNKNQQVALKMSDNGLSITSEVNVLKSFAKVQGSALGPSLLDVDDWDRKSGKISFYVMEFIKGPDLLTFIKNKGSAWTGVAILQLLSDLQLLHENGWVFGDLKPDNLIVTGPPARVRCIDVGGTTQTGRAIKEFTEFFDRGYWGLGSRKADPKYDLFAVAMIIINTAYPGRFTRMGGGIEQLKGMIEKKRELQIFKDAIIKALTGSYSSALEMRHDVLHIMQGQQRSDTVTSIQATAPGKPGRQQQNVSTRSYKYKKKKGRVLETIIIILAISLLYFLHIYNQVF
ncbi:protein kinase domain-containing protein [Bacillus sp. T33-2]|uniref:protein kinase domain-containing protein n=1 Tax=Bacillus sp. T33-2 TaxID=2054168 RepID=UPI000C77FD4A|nr:serine/threonine-protein kinase [Bacillus sp. T33-2]PLR91893.1 serine/threonine protein kinase [Bacillus sp. T33-2]